jgi:hypothetical protein
LHLRRVHELLEARHFSVTNLEYVADLRVQTLERAPPAQRSDVPRSSEHDGRGDLVSATKYAGFEPFCRVLPFPGMTGQSVQKEGILSSTSVITSCQTDIATLHR